MHAFVGRGADARQLRRERLRLGFDMSYFRTWTDPSWMMYPCACGECAHAGRLQYVEKSSEACDWCWKHVIVLCNQFDPLLL